MRFWGFLAILFSAILIVACGNEGYRDCDNWQVDAELNGSEDWLVESTEGNIQYSFYNDTRTHLKWLEISLFGQAGDVLTITIQDIREGIVKNCIYPEVYYGDMAVNHEIIGVGGYRWHSGMTATYTHPDLGIYENIDAEENRTGYVEISSCDPTRQNVDGAFELELFSADFSDSLTLTASSFSNICFEAL